MKTLSTLTVCLLLIMPKLSGQEAALKPYKLKSGIIEYKYSGDKTGIATLYFDDYGMKSAMYSDLVTRGESSKTWVVSSGDIQYMWDLSKPGKGMKMQNPLTAWFKEASKGDVESFTESAYVSKQEATSVKTNIPVDAKYFVIPKNITFSEMPVF